MIVVQTPDALLESVQFLSQCTALFCDLETQGLDPHTDELIILAIHGQHPTEQSQTYVFDLLDGRKASTLVRVRPLLENPNVIKVFHNAVFDWKFLYHSGIYTEPVYCTMIGEQVLRSGLLFSGFNLKDTAERRLGIKMDKEVRNSFIGRDLTIPLTDEELVYAGGDVYVLEEIAGQQKNEAVVQDLVDVFALEGSIIPVTAKMEYYGVCIEDNKLREALPVVTAIIEKASAQLQENIINEGLASEIVFDKNGYSAINVGSMAQMLELFRSMGVNVRSMNKKELSDWDSEWSRKNKVKHVDEPSDSGDDDMHIGYAHPVLRQHAIRTAAAKLEGTYITGLLNRINPVTGRIHPGFKQCGAVSTGRFSSVAPNFTNLPNVDKLTNLGLGQYDIRSMFVPAPGSDFIISDYSGIELSILAAMSNDPRLNYEILQGDIHSYVAMSLIGEKIERVLGEGLTKKNRKKGAHKIVRDLFKKVSYGIIYGSTGYNLYRTLYFDLLAVGITITQAECDEWVERWKNELFPGTGQVLARNSAFAVTRYYTESALGRKRYWSPDVRFDKWRMLAAMREGSNQPIQSTCADMLKRAMWLFDQRVDYGQGRLVACIHDELLTESIKDYTEECVLLVKDVMEESARSFYPDADPLLFIAEPKVSDRYNK